MRVVKRSGDEEAVSFNKVLQRIRKASKGLTINPDVLAQQVLSQIYDGVKTSEIDELTGQLAASLSTNHPDWGTLAANIVTSNHQKKTSDKFSEVMLELSRQPKGSYIHPDLVALCADPGTAERINSEIDYQRDYLFDYFGFKTLEKSYLLRDAKRVIKERPQHVWMRVALALWKTNLNRAFETYHALSKKKFTHATPTLFNSGTPRQQLSSCFLLTMKDDSIMGIYETLKDCAAISQHAGGIGLSIHKIRAKGSIIRGTNGTSNGIVPMLRNFNATARYVDQCFTPDTLVRVADATNIPICDVKEGGDILTSLGYRKVLKNVIHQYNGHVVQLKMDTGAVVRVTDTHPVMAVKSHGNDMDQLRKAIAAKVLMPEFTDIKELEVGDYLIDFPNWNRIAEITSQPYTGQVHDFEIEAPHDYYVNGFGFAHNGGGKRNGSFAIYLEPWHADIEDFLKLKLNTGMEEDRARDLFYALWIPDLFMKRVEANVDWTVFCPDEAPGLDDVWGDAFEALYTKYEAEGRGRKKINAQKLWFQILDAQIETGTPYLLYKDAANAKSNQQNLGTIKSSNLCVAPETMILTDKGQKQIHELENKEITLWNGDAWSKTTVRKTGVNQKLVSVLLSNGAEIHCTPYHKFLVRDSYRDKEALKECKRVDASELEEGMKLAKCDLPLVEGNATEDIPFPYTHGFFCGDGTYHTQSSGKRYPGVALYGEKKKLMSYLEIRSTSGTETAQGVINCLLPTDLAEKYYVPMNASLRCRLEWFAGLLDADGSVVHNGDNESLQIGSINVEFLDNIRLMLQTLGIQSKVTKALDARQTLLPDGKGGRKLYECQPLWRILVSSASLYRLDALGLDCKRLVIKGSKPQRNAEQFVTVVSVTDIGRTDDTYCFNEPLNHAGIFNGILTGNCTEIIEYSAPDETAVCNLASISLPSCVVTVGGAAQFDFAELRNIVRIAVRNLNRVIDINYYPTPETEKSNMRHRPVGLGIQGLADVFALMKYDWESAEAARLNQLIFEHMYFEAVSESARIAESEGSYATFTGSPASQGRLQPDLWNVVPITEKEGTLDWAELRLRAKAGMRNSLLVAPMPTASTSQILGNNECFEPFTTNIYSRRTLAGEFTVLNKYLLAELRETGLWSEGLKNEIIARNGSVQGIDVIPADVQARYKTTWEIKQRILIDMARDRGAFIDQSQSLNLFVADPTYSKLTSMHFYAWKAGLKTGCYYLRSKAPVVAQQFTVDPRLLSAISSGGKVADLSSDSEGDESDEEASTPSAAAPVPATQQPLTKAEERRLLLEKLSAEYEAEEAKGCTMCSS
jgi:ribonucleoside-diphosphate reductase alpha chain